MPHACAGSYAFITASYKIPSAREGSRGSVSCRKTATVQVNLLGIKIPHVLGMQLPSSLAQVFEVPYPSHAEWAVVLLIFLLSRSNCHGFIPIQVGSIDLHVRRYVSYMHLMYLYIFANGPKSPGTESALKLFSPRTLRSQPLHGVHISCRIECRLELAPVPVIPKPSIFQSTLSYHP